MIERELSIAAQNAGNSAAVICAALINTGKEVDIAVFDSWRTHIFEKTLEMAQTDDVAQDAAPAVVKPRCQHGERVWNTGTSVKTGKAWRGWFCPLPRERRNEQCAPQFVD